MALSFLSFYSVSVIGCLFGLTRAVQGSIATRLVESTEFGK